MAISKLLSSSLAILGLDLLERTIAEADREPLSTHHHCFQPSQTFLLSR
jgi:hypothetical protein